MTRQIAFEILRLALDLTKSQTDGKINQDAAVAATLIEIIRKAREACEAHTGELLVSHHPARAGVSGPGATAMTWFYSQKSGVIAHDTEIVG